MNNLISNEIKDYIIGLRRYFHQNPELSLKEYKTSMRIKKELEALNIPYTTICDTGVIAVIQGSEGKTVALRADIDALPVQENSILDYHSQNPGIMHACGHDAHTAMLLGAAKVLNSKKSQLNGTVKLIFQPAEETGATTLDMIASGMLDDVSSVFAIHVAPDIPVGKISIESGPRMAGVDDFFITVHGLGGHGAMPHKGVDALLIGAKLVDNLQSIVSRETDPLDSVVVTVGKFNSGTKLNILSGEATIEGNLRYFNPELKNYFPEALERISKHTAEMYRANAYLKYISSLGPVINDGYCSELARRAVVTIAGEDAVCVKDKMTTSEDFSRYLEKVPGVLAFLGTGNSSSDTCYPLHHERFNIDENSLELGCMLHVQYALDYLSK